MMAAALLFSTGGAAIKASAFSAVQVAGLRSGIAAVFLIAMIPGARRAGLLLSPRTLGIGVTYAATMILFVVANKMTTAASTIFLQSTAPLYLLLLGPWLLREPVRGRDLAFMALLGTGMALFFAGVDPPAPTAPRPVPGNIAAAFSGLTWALTIAGLRWIARDHHEDAGDGAAAVVVVGNVLAASVCVPLGFPYPTPGVLDSLIILFLGVFQIGLAYVFLTTGIRGVGALEASLFLLVEPAFSPIWAWLAHGETPGPLALAGGAIIVGGIALRSIGEAPGAGEVLR